MPESSLNPEKTFISRYHPPIGQIKEICVSQTLSGLKEVFIGAFKDFKKRYPDALIDAARFTHLFKLFDIYFSGKRAAFDGISLDIAGTGFEKRVWGILKNIPYGEVVSYGSLAKKLKSGARAVGGAAGKNPAPIVIPCHRVIKSDSTIGGYSGGVEIKRTLLEIEGIGVIGKIRAQTPLRR